MARCAVMVFVALVAWSVVEHTHAWLGRAACVCVRVCVVVVVVVAAAAARITSHTAKQCVCCLLECKSFAKYA